jgi:glycosyltransferase involved in cell wall biosynthesis
VKIAVYCISKNEQAHVNRFMDSVRHADLVVVADTGSTDHTVELLSERGAFVIKVNLPMFRFDRARNVALSCVPSDVDVCVSMDLDEVAAPGWREAIERAWTPGTTRLRYHFVWNHHADGTPDIEFFCDKIHARHGYHWENAAHEFLTPEDPAGEVINPCGVRIDHWPDASKSRGNYLPLLELTANEKPDGARARFYYGRELMYWGRWREAIDELQRYLRMPQVTSHIERLTAARFVARCLVRLNVRDSAEAILVDAAYRWPGERETWVDLAMLYQDNGDWESALECANAALAITERPKHYCTEAYAWGDLPEKIAKACAHNLGQVYTGA